MTSLLNIDQTLMSLASAPTRERIASLLDYSLRTRGEKGEKIYPSSGRRFSIRVNEKGGIWCQVWTWPFGSEQFQAIGKGKDLYAASDKCVAYLWEKAGDIASLDPSVIKSLGAPESFLIDSATRIERLILCGSKAGVISQFYWDAWMCEAKVIFGKAKYGLNLTDKNKLSSIPTLLKKIEPHLCL